MNIFTQINHGGLSSWTVSYTYIQGDNWLPASQNCTAKLKDTFPLFVSLSDFGKFSVLSELSYFDPTETNWKVWPPEIFSISLHSSAHFSLSDMLSSGAVGADWSSSPSGALDQWRQGVLIQLEPAPVMEIVITEQSRARPQPGQGRQSDNLPLTINNHHPPPH